MEKPEIKQYFPEKEKPEEELKIEIPKELWEKLEIIAKRVGGDFGMEVKLGKPGGRSIFNPEGCSITFDPIHLKESQIRRSLWLVMKGLTEQLPLILKN